MLSPIKIGGRSTLFLVFMALFVPTSYVQIKASFLVLSCSIALIGLLQNKLFLNKESFYSVFVITTIALLYSLWGVYNSAAGAIRVLTVYYIWPWVYLLLSIYLTSEQALESLFKIMVLALIFVVFYSFLYLGYEAGIVPSFLYFELDQGQKIGFYSGYVEYDLYSISSLLFLVPLAIHYFYLKIKIHDSKNIFSWVLLILLSLLLVLLTGRRAVLLIFMLMPFLMLSSSIILGGIKNITLKMRQLYTSPLSYLLVSILFVVSFMLLNKTGISLEKVWLMFSDGFNFESGKSTSERTLQFHSLINTWLNGSVLFGAGNGSATDVVRSVEFSWAYELTYVYLLFSTGIVGVLFYCAWFGYGLLRLRIVLQKRPDLKIYVLPMVTGVFGLAIGAASNPYFGKFDYLWIIMLPHLLAGGLQYQRRAV